MVNGSNNRYVVIIRMLIYQNIWLDITNININVSVMTLAVSSESNICGYITFFWSIDQI